MISSIACSSYTSTRCSTQEQGVVVTKLRSLTQIKGLNLRYFPKRFSTKFSASLPHNLGKIEELTSNNKDSLSKYSYSATSEHGDASVQESDLSISSWTKIAKNLDAFYRFTRPYAIYGIILGITSISLLPIQTMSDFSPTFFIGLLKAIIPMVLMHIYLVGINQLCDIEIDKINKPTYPLASGELSIATGTAITVISAIASFAMGVMFNSPALLIAISTDFFIATVYSVDLPLLRWKKNAILATLCIIGIRALMIPLCFFAHVQKYVLGRPLVYTKPVFFTVAFMTIIATVTAMAKDLPDVEGDKAFGLHLPSIIYGREKVFWSCVYALLMAYGGAVVVGPTLLPNKIIAVLGHGILAAILWTRAKSVNIKEPSSTQSFYLFIWKLLYAEYLLIPLATLC